MQTDDNTFEMGPEEIAEKIFSNPPGDLNSIDLALEEQTAEIAEREGIEQFTSNILRIITLTGIKVLYGNVKFVDLTGEQVELIKRYTRSFGYNLKMNVDEESRQLYVYFERTFI
jgi:hypothetical protein